MSLFVVEPNSYSCQLEAKKLAVIEQFSDFNLPTIELFESPSIHYRQRAEFRLWHDADDLYYVMFAKGNKHERIRIDECPMVAEPIHRVMFELLAVIRQDKRLRFRLFQIDFLSTLSGGLLVSLIYHRPIAEEWTVAAMELKERFNIQIIGRSRKNKIVLENDYLIETFNINGKIYHYKQVENSFSQPNAVVCQQMIEWAVDASKHADGDLVEFYCGNGNFSLPLAQNFRRVVATEISKVSVRAANYNLELNNITNVDVVRISAEEFSQVLTGELEKRRTKNLGLADCNFSTVLVDPPRAGLDAASLAQVQTYSNIIYISCNPESLKDNLQTLCKTHRLERIAIFDQFPYTNHLEMGVFMQKNEP